MVDLLYIMSAKDCVFCINQICYSRDDTMHHFQNEVGQSVPSILGQNIEPFCSENFILYMHHHCLMAYRPVQSAWKISKTRSM